MIEDAKQLSNNRKVRHVCVGCGKEFPHSFVPFCDCGSMTEVEHDLRTARFADSTNPYVRYFDLLPIDDPENLLPVEQEPTPTHHAQRLGKHLGLPWIYVKDETTLPTCTTKDRMAITVLSFLKEVGVTEFTTSSTGNSSTALGHYAKYYPGCRLFIFTGEDFLHRMNFEENDQTIVFGLRGATFVEAFAEAAAYAKRKNLVSERGFFNPARREGLKTSFFEAAEAVERPIDIFVQAISSAMGVYGTYKGAKELMALGKISRLPQLLCVQQESCCPMARAFGAGSEVIRPEDIFPRPTGIAESILRGDPTRTYPYVRGIVLESGGTIIAVSEQEIRDARKMIEEFEGLAPCFTASVAIAGLARQARDGKIDPDKTVLVNLTGGDRPNPRPRTDVHWLERTDTGWQPADSKDSLAWELWED